MRPQNEGHNILIKISGFLKLLLFYHFLPKRNTSFFKNYDECRHILFVFYCFRGVKEATKCEIYLPTKDLLENFFKK